MSIPPLSSSHDLQAHSGRDPILAFPQGQALSEFLNLEHTSHLEDLFEMSLMDPLNDFLVRPRKNIRNHIVQLGFSLASQKMTEGGPQLDLDSICNSCCAVLEIFHAGSLVVDDIQDDSEFRRGRQTLHRLYGMPLALNAGNWLYFLPFKHIEEMPLPRDHRSSLIRECSDTLLRAHYGQALDLGVPVHTLDQHRVSAVSLAAMELKSGVLTGLAFKMGALALGAPTETVKALDNAGRRLGVALQMMDDLGGLTSSKNPAKKGEDLKLKRLGHIFSTASEVLSPSQYKKLQELMDNSAENLEAVYELLGRHEVPQIAKARARKYLEEILSSLQVDFSFSAEDLHFVQSIQTHLVNSYE